jgi:DNA polymerase-3 subunit gamma/tau
VSAQELSSRQQPSLYRRHRPRNFDEVVGQQAVVRTLRNAVARDRVHHAYLFVGSRGTGKTSMAKILAACLNCERGPTIEPCGRCESCVSIANASSLDVIEMDAASNNSVDDIRELRESVTYAPVSGRRKVYILDEAHMLSTAAWNAFLKTLEEPPENTVFVLATTEAQKVPATVVDRCHRFDFQRPGVEEIASVVRRAAQADSIEIPPAAVAAIARAATGSFRDALGTLEQLLTYSEEQIELDDVLAVLGMADARLLEQTLDAVADGDARAALGVVQACVEEGRDCISLISGLQARSRELLVVHVLGEVPTELALTLESDESLRSQARRVGEAVLVRLLELLGEAMEGVRAGADARTTLELSLMKACRPELDSSTRALLARIERLERARAHAAAPHEPAGAGAEAPERAAGTPVAAAEGSKPAAQGAGTGADGSEPAAQDAGTGADGSELAAQGAGVGEASTVLEAPGIGSDAAAGGLAGLRALWPAVVDHVRAENALLGALIEEAEPVAVSEGELTVAFAQSAPFLKKKADDPANRAAVAAALERVTGRRLRLAYELSDRPEARASARPQSSSEEEWVRRFMEEFDAEELPAESEAAAEQVAAEDSPASTPRPQGA